MDNLDDSIYAAVSAQNLDETNVEFIAKSRKQQPASRDTEGTMLARADDLFTLNAGRRMMDFGIQVMSDVKWPG